MFSKILSGVRSFLLGHKIVGSIIVVFVFGLIIGAFYFLRWYYPPVSIDMDESELITTRQYIRYEEALEKAYENDNYGGATPEETLKMFRDALETENYELASKYFLPEKQKEMLGYFNSASESGAIKTWKNILDTNPNEIVISKDGRRAYVTFSYTGYSIGVDFFKNIITEKWKIENL